MDCSSLIVRACSASRENLVACAGGTPAPLPEGLPAPSAAWPASQAGAESLGPAWEGPASQDA